MASRLKGVASNTSPTHTELNLIGQICPNITGTKLPSRQQVLRMYFYGTRQRKISGCESAYLVSDSVMGFWRQAFIPTKRRSSVKKKVVDLVTEWLALQKNTLRGGKTQSRKESEFVEKLDDLFDIAPANANEMITNPKDIAFLQQQREKGRPGCIRGVDRPPAKLQKRGAGRRKLEEEEEDSKRAKLQNGAAVAVNKININ